MTSPNLVTTNPSRFSVIRPELLGPMAVLETLDSEAIITARIQQLQAIWAQNDPPNAAQYDVGNLEFDPIRINQELNAYFELLVRDRVNQAARSVTLAFAVGTDLDAIASRYPYGLPRLTDSSGNPIELDDAYRQRIWLSPSILSLNGPGQGTYESYVFWAMSTPMPAGAPMLKHASAFCRPGTGEVYIVIMSLSTLVTAWTIPPSTQNVWTISPGASPIPTADQISAVYGYITAPGMARKGLTDIVNVIPPKVSNTTIDVDVWLFPGIDPAVAMPALTASVSAMLQALQWLGADLTMLALQGALAQSGVYNTRINSPVGDVIVGTDGCVNVTTATLRYQGTGQ